MYQQIRFVVGNNHFEGWQPSSEDVEFLLKNVLPPDSKLVKEYHEMFADRD